MTFLTGGTQYVLVPYEYFNRIKSNTVTEINQNNIQMVFLIAKRKENCQHGGPKKSSPKP